MSSSSKRKTPRQALITLACLVGLGLLYYFNGSLATDSTAPLPPSQTENSNGYDILSGKIQNSRGNDGDSFWVDLPNGEAKQFRLYFADAPESQKRRYRNGDTNHKRVRQQAAYFRINDEQAVLVGQKAKKYVQQLLETHPFRIHTTHEKVYGSAREYAFIEVQLEDGPHWLHQLLIEQGLARIHTKPAKLPDGRSAKQQEIHLKTLESQAKRKKRGAWGL